ncbi:MAG: gamma-glutamylcyclotransferase family protein [Pelobium sp.]
MEDSFLYFGYGSGLNPTLVEFCVNETVVFIGKGTLKNYALKFNRLNPDGSARGNLIYLENEVVHGLLYQISKKKFEQLAQTEPCYDFIEIEVEIKDGLKKAFAFKCENITENIFPSERYMSLLIQNATENQFPEEYLEKIRQQAKAK